MKKLILFIIFFSFSFLYSQTTLSAGDIAIVGVNTDNPDEFAFVLLTDVTTGTSIRFTDDGWFSAGGFRSGEGGKNGLLVQIIIMVRLFIIMVLVENGLQIQLV